MSEIWVTWRPHGSSASQMAAFNLASTVAFKHLLLLQVHNRVYQQLAPTLLEAKSLKLHEVKGMGPHRTRGKRMLHRDNSRDTFAWYGSTWPSQKRS